ncbi:MAG: glutamate--tRNA ligase family protein [Polyangiaceae bacterium]
MNPKKKSSKRTAPASKGAATTSRKSAPRGAKTRNKTTAPRGFSAKTSDKHDLYQRSVQDADAELTFIDRVFRTRGRKALKLREDFCGTALVCAQWAKSDEARTATGLDLDRDTLDWGIEHNMAPIGDAAKRVTLLEQDVCAPVGSGRKRPVFDVTLALNFSYWVFKTRDAMRAYFTNVLRSLESDGAFILDAYGGWESQEPMLEPRKIQGGLHVRLGSGWLRSDLARHPQPHPLRVQRRHEVGSRLLVRLAILELARTPGAPARGWLRTSRGLVGRHRRRRGRQLPAAQTRVEPTRLDCLYRGDTEGIEAARSRRGTPRRDATQAQSLENASRELATPLRRHMVVGRLAPSPTGFLHLGHARSFLVAFWSARAREGRVVLRLEDIDGARVTTAHVDACQRDLEWLGLDWDGAPRIQSDGLERIREVARELQRRDLAFPCRCTRGDLRADLDAPQQGTSELRYSGRCRNGAAPPKSPDEPAALRFKVPEGEVEFIDEVWGPQSFDVNAQIGDFVLLRRDGIPSYQLAVTVDDAYDGVTEVVRGCDLTAEHRKTTASRACLELPGEALLSSTARRRSHGQAARETRRRHLTCNPAGSRGRSANRRRLGRETLGHARRRTRNGAGAHPPIRLESPPEGSRRRWRSSRLTR